MQIDLDEGRKMLIVLFLSFLIGLEREERKAADAASGFGGVRTFPLIGLFGFALSLLSGNSPLPLALGLIVVGAFMLLSYVHKLRTSPQAGATTEVSGLTTFVLGALVQTNHVWVASCIAVFSILLLELKGALESLTRRIAPNEILTFAQFLLLTIVILPALPDREFTQFHLNPFRAWLIVVAVSGISYGSYVLQRLTRSRDSLILAAMLGGAYSSTVTTTVVARESFQLRRPHLISGAVVVASGVMYFRLAILVWIFNAQLGRMLLAPFAALGAAAVAAGWAWSRLPEPGARAPARGFLPRNPLEIRAALVFALVFVLVLIVTHWVASHLSPGWVYGLAALMGVSDVDPFILGLTQSAGASASLGVAAAGILIASASNNLVKGIYGYVFSEPKARLQILVWMTGLAAAGIAPLIWMGG